MKNFKTKDEALASQNFDPTAVVITGVPEHHIEAVKAFAALCVAHDAVNPEFKPDFTDGQWNKFSNWFNMGSPSGSGFSFLGRVSWGSLSYVGSRLVSESSKASKHVAELFEQEYKAMMVYDRK